MMNRRGANFRYIAFSTVTGRTLARGATADEVVTLACRLVANAGDVEVLDCGREGHAVWSERMPLAQARMRHRRVVCGTGLEGAAK